ncbi:hypothetical protein RIF29_06078 [Crotalaria pallida]|uniref:Uncharacterized protein n=1 Tax=Crotalaria pallida TaxID=3830 RepID=A0AAN9PA46_CROPI
MRHRTIRSFFEANLALAEHLNQFGFYTALKDCAEAARQSRGYCLLLAVACCCFSYYMMTKWHLLWRMCFNSMVLASKILIWNLEKPKKLI